MSFLQLAKEQRYSVRKFSDRAVEKEKLDLILEAGRIAPTACNYQPQRILVIEDDTALEKLKQCTSSHFNAPLALMICYDKTTVWKNKTNGTIGGDVDASIVTTQMMLEVAELGLATTWVGAFDHGKARELFDIPEYIVPVALLPIGYAADGVELHPWHFKRFDIDHTVFYNSFDGITEGEAH